MSVSVEVKTKGDGKNFPKVGDKVEIHYVGTLKSDGTEFDSSRKRNKVFECTIGVGQVIAGWDEAIPKMSMGERSILTIPSKLAYGEKGKSGKIGPNADLVFDVELIAINGKKHYSPEQLNKYQADLEKWAAKKLKEYDDDASFREKRDKKHTNREGYAAWLQGEVKTALAAKEAALQDSKPKPKAVSDRSADSKEIGVTWEDQQRINEFGRLNVRLTEINDELAVKKKNMDDLGDAEGDIECLLEDDACKIKVGTLYVEVSNEEAEEYVQECKAEQEEEIASLGKEKDTITSKMDKLKVLLYQKFGNQINLETNPQE